VYIHTFCLRQTRQASPRARLRVPVTEAVEEAPLNLCSPSRLPTLWSSGIIKLAGKEVEAYRGGIGGGGGSGGSGGGSSFASILFWGTIFHPPFRVGCVAPVYTRF
jgi:hypothetical protein